MGTDKENCWWIAFSAQYVGNDHASRLFPGDAANLTYGRLLRTASCSCAILPLKLNDSLHARTASGSSGQAQLGKVTEEEEFSCVIAISLDLAPLWSWARFAAASSVRVPQQPSPAKLLSFNATSLRFSKAKKTSPPRSPRTTPSCALSSSNPTTPLASSTEP